MDKSEDARLIGLSVGRAAQLIGLRLREHFVVMEPPGVARAVDGNLPNGDWLRLFVRRGALPDRLADPRWDWAEFEWLAVVGVARCSAGRWTAVGQTMLIQPKG
jgi:hypothetical protein